MGHSHHGCHCRVHPVSLPACHPAYGSPKPAPLTGRPVVPQPQGNSSPTPTGNQPSFPLQGKLRETGAQHCPLLSCPYSLLPAGCAGTTQLGCTRVQDSQYSTCGSSAVSRPVWCRGTLMPRCRCCCPTLRGATAPHRTAGAAAGPPGGEPGTWFIPAAAAAGGTRGTRGDTFSCVGASVAMHT